MTVKITAATARERSSKIHVERKQQYTKKEDREVIYMGEDHKHKNNEVRWMDKTKILQTSKANKYPDLKTKQSTNNHKNKPA